MYTRKNRFNSLVIVLIVNISFVSGKSTNGKTELFLFLLYTYYYQMVYNCVVSDFFYWILPLGLLQSEKCSCAAMKISLTGPASRLQPAVMGLYKEVKTKVNQFKARKKFKQIVHLIIKNSKTIYKNNNNLFLTGGKFASWKVEIIERYS